MTEVSLNKGTVLAAEIVDLSDMVHSIFHEEQLACELADGKVTHNSVSITLDPAAVVQLREIILADLEYQLETKRKEFANL